MSKVHWGVLVASALIIVPATVFAGETKDLIVNMGGEVTVLETECEIEERVEYSRFEASLLDPKPAPTCEPLVVPTQAPQFSNPYLSTTYSIFFGEIIGGMTDMVDVSSFKGAMGPLSGHSNQEDIGNFSFALDKITAETHDLKDYNLKGKKLKVVEGSLKVGTTVYRQAFTLRRRGGGEFVGAAEARIALQSAFELESTETLLQLLDNRMAPCLKIATRNQSSRDPEQRSWGVTQASLCNALSVSRFEGSPSQKAFEMIKTWKANLMERIQSIHQKDPQSFVSPKCDEITAIANNPALGSTASRYKAVKDQYCGDSYQEILEIMDKGIEVAYVGNEAIFKLHIENINKQIGDRFPEFFETFKLDVVVVKNFAAKFANDTARIEADFSIKQPQERVTHGIAGVGGLAPLFDMYQGVRSEIQARSVGNLMAKATMGILKRKLPGVFTNITLSRAGFSGLGSLIKNESVGAALEAKDAVSSGVSGIGGLLFGSDDEDE